jgi:hypothetical protein
MASDEDEEDISKLSGFHVSLSHDI